ncbi:hypothetical protein GCM10007304_30180 [Rhodococcoides trifolii]|uniref:Uncharacterized protein n=1 Tax=Rhodococcoides trifolii TaxID=908250 RepID=A0A917FYD4_9NOCA|nr:hypothetical protein [Rhodococcus trifolii]GGG14066.1 hypothetical protein GCM10007304_30180 [Rhodococcus trifolii]
MNKLINGFNTTRLQIEANRQDLYSPGQLALSNGVHDILISDSATQARIGMSKAGTQTVNRTDWQVVTGFTADARYPGSTLSGDKLVVPTTHRGIISGTLYFLSQSSGIQTTIWARLKVNNTVVRVNNVSNGYKFRYANQSVQAVRINFVYDLNAGDEISIETKYEGKKKAGGLFGAKVDTFYDGTLVAGSSVDEQVFDRKTQDFAYDMAFPNDSEFYYNSNSQFFCPDFGKKMLNVYDVTGGDTTNANPVEGRSWGPILVQSKVPIDVDTDSDVWISGTFRFRNFAAAQKETGTVVAKVALWGRGYTEDAYGKNDVDRELLVWEVPMTAGATVTDFTVPEHDPTTITPDIKQVYFVVYLYSTTQNKQVSANYKKVGSTGNEESVFGWYNDRPLKISVRLPSEKQTQEHKLSSTGVGFLDRRFFANVVGTKKLTYMGLPGQATAFSVYQYNGTRGALIGSYTALADEHKQVSIASPTGQIEIVGNSTTVNPAAQSKTKTVAQSLTSSYAELVMTTANAYTATHTGTINFAWSMTLSDDDGGRMAGLFVNGVMVKEWTIASATTASDSASVAVNAGDSVVLTVRRTSISSSSVNTANTSMTYQPIVTTQHYLIESLLPVPADTYTQTTTLAERITWQNVADELTNVTLEREEFNAGKLKLRFKSDALADGSLIRAGKRVRLVTVNYGNTAGAKPGTAPEQYVVVFTGTIRDYKTEYDYNAVPYIEVTVMDALQQLDETRAGFFYDRPVQYAQQLHASGKQAKIDALDVTGKYVDGVQSYKLQPSAYQESARIKDSLEAMRNSNKGFVYVDRYDYLRYQSQLDQTIKLTVSDDYQNADLSYGRIEKSTDTESIINVVEPEEYSLNYKDLEERSASGETPVKLEPYATETKVATYYYRPESIDAYGERKEQFPVVRGTGQRQDINLQQLGSDFSEWSRGILNDYDLDTNTVTRVMVIPQNWFDIKRLSGLELLDKVCVFVKGEKHVMRVRHMEWFIDAGHIRVELTFSRSKRQSAWGAVPTFEYVGTDNYTDVYGSTY